MIRFRAARKGKPMSQLLCHLVGDYLLQNTWMGENKSKKTWICLLHVILYTSVFLFLTTSWKALLFIGITHFILDRFQLMKYLIWWKTIGGRLHPNFGFHPDTPPYQAFFIYVVSDNTIHLLCNALALACL